jgi:hypothetical protein
VQGGLFVQQCTGLPVHELRVGQPVLVLEEHVDRGGDVPVGAGERQNEQAISGIARPRSPADW